MSSSASNFDWIFWLTGGLLGALGLWLLYWSLLRDRARGRRRCPKCWYDMSGTAGLRCSECGNQAKRERKMVKTRRRWGWLPVPIVLLLIAAALTRGPAYMRGGFAASLPTTVLLAMLPRIEDHQDDGSWRGAALAELLTNRVGVGAAIPSEPMWKWQQRWLYERALRHLERSPSDWKRAPLRRQPYGLYWLALSDAWANGVLHEFGLQDRFGALLPPTHEVAGVSPLVSGGPFRFSFRRTWTPGPLTDWPDNLELFLPDGRKLAWEFTEAPRGGDRPIDRGKAALARLPSCSGPIEIRLQMKSAPSYRVGPKSLRIAPSLLVQDRINAQVSALETVLPVNPDPAVDRVIREGFRFQLDLENGPPVMRARLAQGSVVALEHFESYVWSMTLLRDGQPVCSGVRRMDALLGDDTTWGSAVADFPISADALRLVRGAAEGRDEAPWTVRFRMEPEQMVMWMYRPGLTYWDGVIEQPIDWSTVADN